MAFMKLTFCVGNANHEPSSSSFNCVYRSKIPFEFKLLYNYILKRTLLSIIFLPWAWKAEQSKTKLLYDVGSRIEANPSYHEYQRLKQICAEQLHVCLMFGLPCLRGCGSGGRFSNLLLRDSTSRLPRKTPELLLSSCWVAAEKSPPPKVAVESMLKVALEIRLFLMKISHGENFNMGCCHGKR